MDRKASRRAAGVTGSTSLRLPPVRRSFARVEDADLLCGRGRFGDDLPVRIGTLHAAILRSPHAHAELLSVNAEAASAIPGAVTANRDWKLNTAPDGHQPIKASNLLVGLRKAEFAIVIGEFHYCHPADRSRRGSRRRSIPLRGTSDEHRQTRRSAPAHRPTAEQPKIGLPSAPPMGLPRPSTDDPSGFVDLQARSTYEVRRGRGSDRRPSLLSPLSTDRSGTG